jgi:putative transposase
MVTQVYFKFPFYGHRKINEYLKNMGIKSNRDKVKKAMKELGIKAIYPGPRTTVPAKDHEKYPYLLNGLEITDINQVWSSDITYVKYKGSFMYLVAVIDVYSRKVLSWRLSNTLDSYFCCECLSEAISFFGIPEIFNTDQGSQFTGKDFIDILKNFKIKISMDGKGRALDNVYIERLWRTLKYENIFLYEYESVTELKKGIDRYFKFYNTERLHQNLNYKTPDDIYWGNSESVSSF